MIGIVLCLSILLSICFGSARISIRDLFRVISSNDRTTERAILLYVRIPRVIGAVFAGAALSTAGMIIQCVLNNSLASPNIIGVNAGAGFFVALSLTIYPTITYLVPVSAFVGALTAMLFIYWMARRTRASKTTVVLAGIAINSILNAGTDMIHVINPTAVISTMEFRVGGLSAIDVKILIPAGIMITVSLVVLYCYRTQLEVLMLGDEVASSLGLSTEFIRFLTLVIAAVLAGAAVSFCGLLGFVGLIVPHIVRFLVGSEVRFLIPGSVMSGAVCVLLSDLAARVLFRPYELPAGIILAMVGAPFFLYLLLSKKRGIRHD